MKLFNKTTEVKRLPEPELKRIPIDNLEFAPYQRELKMSKVNKIANDFMPSRLIASANNYVKCDMLRPGRADSACYHIAKMIARCYEEELCKPKRGKKVQVI